MYILPIKKVVVSRNKIFVICEVKESLLLKIKYLSFYQIYGIFQPREVKKTKIKTNININTHTQLILKNRKLFKPTSNKNSN